MADKPDYKTFKFVDNSKVKSGRRGYHGKEITEKKQKKKEKGDGVGRNGDWINDNSVTWNDTRLEKRSAGGEDGIKERKMISTEISVVDSYAPDLTVFLQDSNYQFVKEIFMDSGVSLQSRIWDETFMLDHRSLSRVIFSNEESDSESSAGTSETISSCSSESKHDEEYDDCGKEAIKHCVFDERLVAESEEECDRNSISQSPGKIVPGLKLVREVPVENAELVNLVHMATSKSKATDDSSCTIVEIEMESGSTETGTEKLQEDAGDCPKPVDETRSKFAIVDSMSRECLTGSNEIFDKNPQYGNEESGSFVIGPFLGRIGAMPYSGSPSLRSNSSNASSFAFPILASEWNGSPVRMVEADRKQVKQQQQSWRMCCFLCCKF